MVKTDASERDNIRKALMASKSGYYKTAYYKNFVETVKQRDHHTCQACGTRFNQSDAGRLYKRCPSGRREKTC